MFFLPVWTPGLGRVAQHFLQVFAEVDPFLIINMFHDFYHGPGIRVGLPASLLVGDGLDQGAHRLCVNGQPANDIGYFVEFVLILPL